MTILENLWSWQFGSGMVAGFVLSRVWCLLRVMWLDKREPLPDGRRRSKWSAVSVDPRLLAAVIGALFLGWSVLTTQENATQNARIAADAKAFATATRQCQLQLIAAIRQSRQVSAENDVESEKQRDALAAWLGTLLNPPAEIAKLDGADPVRQRWAIDVTQASFAEMQASQDRQRRNEASRAPLPEPDCGR